MDKAEYKSRLRQINDLAEEGEFARAAQACDEIDWKKVKSVRTLCMVGEIYEAARRYEDSMVILKLAYKRSPVSKTVLYRMTELSIRAENVDDAKKYLNEYEQNSPNDNSKYVLQYKLLKLTKASLDDKIEVLKEYKEHEYTERWSYELARLYRQNGQKEKCIEECDDLILWFSEGKYVYKAMELKMKYMPLTKAQQKAYDNRFNKKAETPEPTTAAARLGRALRTSDEMLTEELPKLSTIEAIMKMDAAADKTLRAAGIDETRDAGKGRRRTFLGRKSSGANPGSLAESFRQAVAAIRRDKSEDFADGSGQEEDLTNVHVKDLEPETIGSRIAENEEKPAAGTAKAGMPAPKITASDDEFDRFMKTDKDGQIDLDALFRETGNVFSGEVASGQYEMTDELENAKDQDTFDQIQASNQRKNSKASPEEVKADLGRAHEMLYGKETDESLGLTREFNFQQELQKALKEGKSVREATDEIRDRAEIEALRNGTVKRRTSLMRSGKMLSPEVEAKRTVMMANGMSDTEFELTEEDKRSLEQVPAELLADESELSGLEEETPDFLMNLSAVSESEGEEQSKSILDHIMSDPEIFTEVPVEPRELTSTEEKIFTYFSRIPGMPEQITTALADVHNNSGDKTSRSGNILIMGRPGSGKTRLADGLVVAICQELGIDAAKIARVIGSDFNKKDAASVVKKLSGGFLLIEAAGELSDESIDTLLKAMEFRTDDLVVMLEDEKQDIRNLIKKHADIEDKFTSVITVPVMTNDELVTFAKTYAREKRYKLDELGTLALYTIIGENQKDSEPVTVGKVKIMMDKAILRNSRRFGRKATSADGRTLLRERDFNF